MKSFFSYILALTVFMLLVPFSAQGRSNSKDRIIPLEFPFKSKDKVKVVSDPFYVKNWGLKMVNAAKAWKIEKGKKDIVIAVIDTGADTDHKDLKANIWKNPGETGLDSKGNPKATNGIDDDGNGYIDDVHGWNFVTGSNDLTDSVGHGTHISGIIGAVSNATLMILKYYDPKAKGKDPVKASLAAIKYAIDKGANIINYSGGGTGKSVSELKLLREAESKGIAVIVAAGNEFSDTSKKSYYPSSYKLSNIISVASVDKKGKLIRQSNYGASIDLAAPGHNIYSTMPGNRYGYLTGTSQATAFVSGAVALMQSKHPGLSLKKIKKKLLSSVDKKKALLNKIATGGILDIVACLINNPKLALRK